ncbi:hypothetical protein Cus16_1432 [Curtobacterium sp. ER1/6]|nr:hypothetical protein Cus16_1432 [Curtobacterium sp. ER1/6]
MTSVAVAPAMSSTASTTAAARKSASTSHQGAGCARARRRPASTSASSLPSVRASSARTRATRVRSVIEEPGLGGAQRELDARRDAEGGEQCAHVLLDRPGAHADALPDLGVARARGDQAQDVVLPGGERRRLDGRTGCEEPRAVEPGREHDPAAGQGADVLGERLRVGVLEQEARRAGFHRLRDDLCVGVEGGEHGDRGRFGQRAEGVEDLEPVDPRHPHVEQDDVWTVATDRLDGVDVAARGDDVDVRRRAEDEFEAVPDEGLVVHDHHRGHGRHLDTPLANADRLATVRELVMSAHDHRHDRSRRATEHGDPHDDPHHRGRRAEAPAAPSDPAGPRDHAAGPRCGDPLGTAAHRGVRRLADHGARGPRTARQRGLPRARAGQGDLRGAPPGAVDAPPGVVHRGDARARARADDGRARARGARAAGGHRRGTAAGRRGHGAPPEAAPDGGRRAGVDRRRLALGVGVPGAPRAGPVRVGVLARGGRVRHADRPGTADRGREGSGRRRGHPARDADRRAGARVRPGVVLGGPAGRARPLLVPVGPLPGADGGHGVPSHGVRRGCERRREPRLRGHLRGHRIAKLSAGARLGSAARAVRP